MPKPRRHAMPEPRRRAMWPMAVTLLGLAACSGGGEAGTRSFGTIRDVVDQFDVTTRAPLQIPADITLPPPKPGAPRPQEVSLREQAEATLDPQVELKGADAAPSPGERALAAAAGPPAPPEIRRLVNIEGPHPPTQAGVLDTMMFWHTPAPPREALDAAAEAARLKHNQAAGRSPTVGPIPIFQPKSPGLLDELF